MKPMAESALKLDEHVTYGQYRTWPDEERWEIIDGVAYCMSPAPTYRHQDVAGWLFVRLANFLEGKACKVYISPVDVLLPKPGQSDDQTDTVVQPDIIVACDPAKLEGRFHRGAPDLAVEVLSPSTSRKDQHEKYMAYERSGMCEYWVIEPRSCWLNRYTLGPDGKYGNPLVREQGDRLGPVGSAVLAGFFFDPEALFEH